MSDQDVSTALGLAMDALRSVAESLVELNTRAMKEQRWSVADKTLLSAKAVQSFQNRLGEMQSEWDEQLLPTLPGSDGSNPPSFDRSLRSPTGFPRPSTQSPKPDHVLSAGDDADTLVVDLSTRAPFRTPVRTVTGGRAPAKRLCVTMADGQIIRESTAAQTLLKAIERVGIDSVYELRLPVNRMLLIDTAPDTRGIYEQHRVGRYWVCTHSSTAQKMHLLENIAARLGKVAKVESV